MSKNTFSQVDVAPTLTTSDIGRSRAEIKKKQLHDKRKIYGYSIKIALLQVNVKMEDIVAIRAQRMWFKEQLILVADKRETMENVYAMQFDEQYAKLRTETVLRS